jgi:hypothetical protein
MDEIKPEDEESIFQEENKVHDTELKLINNPVDQLDIILTILNNEDVKPYSIHIIKYHITRQKLKIPDKDLQLAVDKLCEDKHALLIENFDGRSPAGQYKNESIPDKSYRINYLGRIFLKRFPSFILRNKPYKRQEIIQSIQKTYIITKTVATISYSLIIVFIAYWGVKLTDKTNRLEDELRKTEKINRKQIDSLIKLTNDTTQLKIK